MSDGDYVTGRKIKQGRRAGVAIGAEERWSINRIAREGFTQQMT